MLLSSADKRILAVVAAIAACFVFIYSGLFSCEKVFTSDSIVWYGSFHYFIETLAGGHFPLWDPYLNAGTYFYPNIPHHGLLDPVVLPGVLLSALFGLSPLTIYVYLHILRLLINAFGAYLFFRHLTKSRNSSALAAGILLFALPHSYFKQYGVLDHFYLIPYAFWLLMLLFENASPARKYLYLAGVVLISGITMNIYIPVQYTFNLLFFVLGIFIFRAVPMRQFREVFRGPKFLAFTAVSVFVLVIMLAPPLSLVYKDATKDGELFPMQRIIQKNDAIFKQLVASEVNTSNLSNKFTGNQAVFNSWGNVVNLIYPDLLHSFRYWADQDMMSEIDQYIGIIPLMLAIVGLLFFRSRYRYLILLMLALNFINGFSSYGFMNKPFNGLQEILNLIFPPLQMSQGRETFGYFVIFFMCAYASMGLTVMLQQREVLKARLPWIITLCAALIGLKAVMSWYYLGKLLYISAYDLVVLLQLPFFALLALLAARGRLRSEALYLVVSLVVIADMAYYNRIFRDDVLQDSTPFYRAFETSSRPADEFQFFTEPLVMLPLGGRYIAFEESISRTKGALSLGYNHSLFTTKRYYDILTNVPLQNQFLLEGIVYPTVNFVPKEKAIRVSDRRELLSHFVTSDLSSAEQKLFIEGSGGRIEQTSDFGDLRRYPDVEWLKLQNVFSHVNGALNKFMDLRNRNAERLGALLNSASSSVAVTGFSANEVLMKVSSREDGYLHYNDGWSKYWEAYDNGRKVPVYIANYNSKAVFLQAGDHDIRFVFNPAHYKFALMLYYLGLVITLVMLGYSITACRNTGSAPEE